MNPVLQGHPFSAGVLLFDSPHAFLLWPLGHKDQSGDSNITRAEWVEVMARPATLHWFAAQGLSMQDPEAVFDLLATWLLFDLILDFDKLEPAGAQLAGGKTSSPCLAFEFLWTLQICRFEFVYTANVSPFPDPFWRVLEEHARPSESEDSDGSDSLTLEDLQGFRGENARLLGVVPIPNLCIPFGPQTQEWFNPGKSTVRAL